MIYFRHYKIIIQEGGIDKSFSKLLEQKNLDLSRFSSIGEYLKSLNQGDEEKGENQQKVKLVEMGPRFKLKFLNFKEKSGYVEEEEGEEEGEEPGPQNAEVADDDE